MKIAINALSAKSGGGVTYLRELISHLHEVNDSDEYYVFVTPGNRHRILSRRDPRLIPLEVGIHGLCHRLLYEQIVLPFRLRKLGVDILYAPAEVAPFLASCSVVLGIQNPNIYYEVGFSRPISEKARYWILRQLAKRSTRKATRVIFVSDTALRDIGARLGLDHAKTKAIHHGVEIESFGRPGQSVDTDGSAQDQRGEEYILCVSALSRHKNIEVLLRAYSALPDAFRERYRLVVVGRNTSRYGRELSLLVRTLHLEERVTFSGDVPHEDVPAIYHGASLFVLPSYLETFGIPLIEAMASGVPVVAANASAIPEVVGDSALLFNPHNPRDLCDQMVRVLTDEELRTQLVQKGRERLKHFSWERCARETRAVFQKAHALGSGES